MISKWNPIGRVVQATRIQTFSPQFKHACFSRWLFSLFNLVSLILQTTPSPATAGDGVHRTVA